MPKSLQFIKGQSGFVLPYVMFLSAVILLILTTSISLYHNEVRITQMELEEFNVETLLQMGLVSYQEETKADETQNEHYRYSFPQGQVTIEHTKNKNRLYMTVTTDQQTTRSFSVPLPDHEAT